MALTTGQNETDFASIEKEPFLPTLIVFQSQTQGSLCNVSKSQTHVGSDRRGLPVNLCLKNVNSYLQVSSYNVLTQCTATHMALSLSNHQELLLQGHRSLNQQL